MALLRDRFYQEYKRHTRNGFYPIRDRVTSMSSIMHWVEMA